MSLKFYSVEEMRQFSESEVIQYSSALMSKKVELADKALNGDMPTLEEFQEAQRISEELKLLAHSREIFG